MLQTKDLEKELEFQKRYFNEIILENGDDGKGKIVYLGEVFNLESDDKRNILGHVKLSKYRRDGAKKRIKIVGLIPPKFNVVEVPNDHKIWAVQPYTGRSKYYLIYRGLPAKGEEGIGGTYTYSPAHEDVNAPQGDYRFLLKKRLFEEADLISPKSDELINKVFGPIEKELLALHFQS